jgi:hypothetical protein
MLKVLDFLYVLESNVGVVFDHSLDLTAESLQNVFVLKNEENGHRCVVGGSVRACDHESLYLVHQILVLDGDFLAVLLPFLDLLENQLNNAFGLVSSFFPITLLILTVFSDISEQNPIDFLI